MQNISVLRLLIIFTPGIITLTAAVFLTVQSFVWMGVFFGIIGILLAFMAYTLVDKYGKQ